MPSVARLSFEQLSSGRLQKSLLADASMMLDVSCMLTQMMMIEKSEGSREAYQLQHPGKQ